MNIFRNIIKFIGLCSRCEKKFLGILILLVLFNVYFFILFAFYFTDIPEFTEHKHLRRSPYVYQNGSFYPLSEDRSHTLPSFSLDQSEFIMSAIIDRQAIGADQLYITVFALNRLLLSQGRSNWGPNRIKKEDREVWHTVEKKSRRIYYFRNGTRDRLSNINCQITTTEGAEPYVTSGRFIPNTLSIDDSFNSKIDIFRCDMRGIVADHRHLITSNQSVHVQLLRPLRNGRLSSLLNFSIPWCTRRAGYMQQRQYTGSPGEAFFQYSRGMPESESDSTDNSPLQRKKHHISQALPTMKESLSFSQWDPWEHYDDAETESEANPSDRNRDSSVSQPPLVYLCLSGQTMSPFVDNVALLLEFVQHHLLLGVQHIFLSVKYAWDSLNMHSLLLALRYFIEQRTVTVSSQASDGYDRTASTKGIAWGDEFLHLYHCTVTLYLQKGMAADSRGSYLGVWNLDEFLIPQHPFLTLESVIKHSLISTTSPHSDTTEITATPCYILFRSRSLLLNHAFRHEEGSYSWIGIKFAADFHYLDLVNHTWLGAFNFMLPVGQSFQLGIPYEAVCQAQLDSVNVRGVLSNVERMEYDSNSADFKYKRGFGKNESQDSFYDSAENGVHVYSSALLYKFLTEGVDSNKRRLYNFSKVNHKNRYIADFSQKVLGSLKGVNLDLIISLNLPKEATRVGTAVEHWPQFKTIDEESMVIY